MPPPQEARQTRWTSGALARGLYAAGLVAAGYYLSARLAYAFTFRPSGVVVIWVPAGFLFAILLTLDQRRWPFALAGGFAGNLVADLGIGLSPAASLLGATANGLEALVAAWLVVRLVGVPVTLTRLKEVLAVGVGAAIASNAITALLGAAVLVRGAGLDYGRAWSVWWIGDGIGMLIVAPVILTWVAVARSPRRPPPRALAILEGALLLGILVAVANRVLGHPPDTGVLLTSEYMTLPLAFWAALRFGPVGAATATLLLSAISAWYAARGVGPFAVAGMSSDTQVIRAYTFFSLASLSSLVPAAVLSERRAAEDRMQAGEEHYRRLFESNPHPMWIYDPDTLAFLAVNDAAVRQYGFSRDAFLAMTIKDIRPPDEIPRLLGDVQAGHLGLDTAGIWKHRRQDGTLLDVEIISHELLWLGRPAKVVTALDITERQELQKQLLQAQKMEAIGQLAGGIAHDFNNALSVILGYSEVLLMDLPGTDPRREHLQEIKKAGEHAAGLTRQLLAFSRKQVLEPRVVDLNAAVADLSRMLQRTLGENIRLVTSLTPGLGAVKVDPSQLEQVIMNLSVNARDAMPHGGQLTIETADVLLDEGYARDHVIAPGRYVRLAVSDTGCGMDAETREHIFEPFYTTKEKGKGTGLGLSTVYGIVKQGGGDIWVYSERNKGTTFKIYFPLVESGEAVPSPERSPARGLEGTETILLVEDDEGIRKLVQESLGGKGYQLLAAGHAADALRQARHHAAAIHLLITDVVLPDAGGPDLADQVLALHPETRVLFMSGYTDNAIVHHGVLDRGIRFLQKPFALSDLWRKVREVLDTARAPGA